ncbi:gamma-glutamyl-gamma-aminobutyrate hydrolase family protein [Parahaliea mediterranea]|uniref:Gamma-glutamyl-gamma-aminobutyrate hydrolase family protein n=1 Tax=Parahaliea mediterranea TaxID=651086 RepID=A0A939DDE4_9GAMM|nr:gamma-glutamyl-gamma-aminobutyrate hydrolase family protein [Parahaliea mediterranea]
MSAPLIGVTGPDRGPHLAWYFIRWALWRVGARALRMTPSSPGQLASLDGIVISGGDDIDPALYLPHAPERAPMDPERDRFEIDALRHVIDTDMPVLGICRGAQLMNVVLGGNLHTDLRPLRRHTSNRRTPLARKTLAVSRGTELHALLGEDQVRINSLHHQAIDHLGDHLVICGRDLDGFVQAVEMPGRRFLLGVQWHPEYLPSHRGQLGLFRALVQAASHDSRRMSGGSPHGPGKC